jgi:hypothetical protein
MKPTSQAERRRLALLVTLLVLVAAVAAVRLTGRGGLVGGSGGGGETAFTYEPHDLPALLSTSGDADEDRSAGSGRNPFAFGVPPTPTPHPVTPRPTAPPLPTRPPRPTATPRPDGMPPPRPFDRQFIGHFGPAQLKVAALRRPAAGEGASAEIEVASEGEVLDGYYIIRSIGLESREVGFVGYPQTERERVPLVEN